MAEYPRCLSQQTPLLTKPQHYSHAHIIFPCSTSPCKWLGVAQADARHKMVLSKVVQAFTMDCKINVFKLFLKIRHSFRQEVSSLPQKMTLFLIFKDIHHKNNIGKNNPEQKLLISIHIAHGRLGDSISKHKFLKCFKWHE